MLRRWLRLTYRMAALAWTTSEALAEFAWRRARGPLSRRERAEWLHRWCAVALPRLRIEVRSAGAFPHDGLLVANHLSYLDILVLSALAPCVFVAKLEVKRWPVYGWMARLSGTVFVDRASSRDAARAAGEMEEALAEGVPVVLFPEGTSSDGTVVLPFRSPLFEPAVRRDARLTPAHLSYVTSPDGEPGQDVCYWGEMTFVPHLVKLLALERIACEVRMGKPRSAPADRKAAAHTMHTEVCALAMAGMALQSAPDEARSEALART